HFKRVITLNGGYAIVYANTTASMTTGNITSNVTLVASRLKATAGLYAIILNYNQTETPRAIILHEMSTPNVNLTFINLSCSVDYVFIGHTCIVTGTSVQNVPFCIKVRFLSSGSLLALDSVLNTSSIIKTLPLGGYASISRQIDNGVTNFTFILYDESNKLSNWIFPLKSIISNIFGGFDVLQNNTMLVAQNESNNAWNLLSIDLPLLAPHNDSGYGNLHIKTTNPPSNSMNFALNSLMISITFYDRVSFSDGNLYIYQQINQSNILRQIINKKTCVINSCNISDYVINLEIYSCTFNDPEGQYFIQMDTDFVMSSDYKEPIPGINPNIWTFQTETYATSSQKITGDILGKLRLTTGGTQYFQGLTDSGKHDFFTNLINELVMIIPIKKERLSSDERYQIDLSSIDSVKILISLSISDAKSGKDRIATDIKNDLNLLIQNKEFTNISTGATTKYLDKTYGFKQASSPQEFFKSHQTKFIMLFVAAFLFSIVFFVARYNSPESKNFVIFQLGLTIFRTVTFTAFVFIDAKAIQVIHILSMLSYRLPELSSDSDTITNGPHDTLIEIYDKRSNKVKIFEAHSNVLCNRCEYFKIALSDKWARKVDDMYKLRLEVSFDAFELIFNGICSGTIILNEPSIILSMELLLISDILLLNEFIDFLKPKLLERSKTDWRDEDIIYILKASYRISSVQELYLICQDMVAERPMILFGSQEFTSIEEEILLSILKLDMICVPEITILNKLIEWGIANTPNYDTITDNTNRMNALRTTLEEGLQLIRYNNIKSDQYTPEFNQILPSKEVLYKIPPRINQTAEPKVINNRLAGLILAWIDRKDPMKVQYTGFNSPFRFRHVFRMNDNTEFSSQLYRFHQCNKKLPTIKCHEGPSLMIMKLKGSEKIIGAYNPIQWKQSLSNICGKTSESFIFSCDDRFGVNYRLSRVRNFDHAVYLVNTFGTLNFGEDLTFIFDKEKISCQIKNKFYEQTTLTEGIYEIEEWNIYKVRRKDDQPMRVMTKLTNSPIESKIINNDFFGLVATWIDKKDPVEDHYISSNLPYQFTPIFRMKDNTAYYPRQYYNQSSNRLLPTMKCHHEPSLMVMKLKTSGKIIGAYNPIDWKYGKYRTYPTDEEFRHTSESFIFSCEDMDGKDYRLSRVVNYDKAICSEKISTYRKDLNSLVLKFGDDLKFIHRGGRNNMDYISCYIKDGYYEQPAIMPTGYYEIDQWEIFKVTKKDPESSDIDNEDDDDMD
ncbi:6118_t:CDS:2, partial [Scutellospora calospora]